MLLTAPYKSGKSTLCNQIALGLIGACDLFEPLSAPSKLTVLYFQFEMAEFIVYERLAATGIIPPKGKFYVGSPKWMKVDDPKGLAYLKAVVSEIKPDVVMLDPLYKLHNRDENDAGDMQVVFDGLDEIVYDFNLGLILIHHHRKEYTGPGGDISRPESRARGTSKLEDWPDTLMTVTKDIKNDLRVLNFICRRNPDMEDITLQFNKTTWLYDVVAGKSELDDYVMTHLPSDRQDIVEGLQIVYALDEVKAESVLKRLSRQKKIVIERDPARHGRPSVVRAL